MSRVLFCVFLYIFLYMCGVVSLFQLEQKQIPPPYRPRLESERDLANFPPEFTDEPVRLTPDDTYVFSFSACFILVMHNWISETKHLSFRVYCKS